MRVKVLTTLLGIWLVLSLITTISSPAQALAQDNRNRLPGKQEQLELADKLIGATRDYRHTLDKLVEFAQQDVTRASENLAKHKLLFQDGLIARRMVTDSEQALVEANSRLAAITKNIEDADEMIAEAEAAKLLITDPPDLVARDRGGFIRYSGSTRWILQESGKVENFFKTSFGRTLPISAYGQTAVHDRLGFDHRNAMDVAVSPDSPEGQALMRYLREAGIPFLAFPHAIQGAATGAHIHIGRPSSRLSTLPPS